jgi:predicted phage terminase large subunit-like protein
LASSKGFVRASGTDAAITGYGFGLGIMDDPVENWAAAQSEVKRESTWQWWDGTFKPRIWENGSILLMMTRWNIDDVAARILDKEGTIQEGGRWEVLIYPALAEEGDILGRAIGDALAPSRYSKQWLEAQRETMTTYVWNAEYQQHPVTAKGNYFKPGMIKIIEPHEVPEALCNFVGDLPSDVQKGTRFWDLAATEKKAMSQDPDAVSGSLLSLHLGITYWLDNVTMRAGPLEVKNTVDQTAKLDGRRVNIRVEQEPGASGKILIENWAKSLPGYKMEGVPSSGDKVVRASDFAGQVNAGNVYMLKGAWNKGALARLAEFPFGAHDDEVDSASGAYNNEVGMSRLWRSQDFAAARAKQPGSPPVTPRLRFDR